MSTTARRGRFGFVLVAIVILAGAAGRLDTVSAQDVVDPMLSGGDLGSSAPAGPADPMLAPPGTPTIGSGSAAPASADLDSFIQAVKSSKACHLCRFVNDLAGKADSYGGQVAANVASAAWTCWRGLLSMYFIWVFFTLLTGEKKWELHSLIKIMCISGFTTSVLSSARGGADGIFWKWAYLPIKNFSCTFASAMITGVSNVSVPTSWEGPSSSGALTSQFAQLFGTMENSVFVMILTGVKVMTLPPMSFSVTAAISYVVGYAINFLFGMLLMVPYVFIVAIFGAYVIESLFMFLAVNCVSPILVMLALFDKTRQFLWIGLRIYVCAGLTLIFAGIAMGFTVAATNTYFDDLYNLVSTHPDLLIMNWQYWLCLFIGAMSVLFHLKAKELATNFSGAQSSAGPAAAIAGAMTAPMIGAVGAIGRAALSKGGRKMAAGAALGMATGGAAPIAQALGSGLAASGMRDWAREFRERRIKKS